MVSEIELKSVLTETVPIEVAHITCTDRLILLFKFLGCLLVVTAVTTMLLITDHPVRQPTNGALLNYGMNCSNTSLSYNRENYEHLPGTDCQNDRVVCFDTYKGFGTTCDNVSTCCGRICDCTLDSRLASNLMQTCNCVYSTITEEDQFYNRGVLCGAFLSSFLMLAVVICGCTTRSIKGH